MLKVAYLWLFSLRIFTVSARKFGPEKRGLIVILKCGIPKKGDRK